MIGRLAFREIRGAFAREAGGNLNPISYFAARVAMGRQISREGTFTHCFLDSTTWLPLAGWAVCGTGAVAYFSTRREQRHRTEMAKLKSETAACGRAELELELELRAQGRAPEGERREYFRTECLSYGFRVGASFR